MRFPSSSWILGTASSKQPRKGSLIVQTRWIIPYSTGPRSVAVDGVNSRLAVIAPAYRLGKSNRIVTYTDGVAYSDGLLWRRHAVRVGHRQQYST
jgi:hypothetical protein